MNKKRAVAIAGVVIAATIFGFLGLPVRYLNSEYGLVSIDSVVVRLTFASLFLLIILGIVARDKLKIRRKDIPLMILFGAFKLLSDFTFFYAQNNISLGLATLLQMSAPYFVMIFSLFLFRERLTIKKMVAMAIATIGSILVTGVLTGDAGIEHTGGLAALMSGLFFALFIVGSRVFNERGITPAAGLFYTLLFADLLALPFCNHANIGEALMDIEGIAMCLALGVMLTLVPFYLYAWSTQFIEPTLTSMVSVLEIVAATIVGYLFFSEGVTLIRVIGMALVIVSVILVNIRIHIDYTKRFGRYVPKVHKEGIFRKPKDPVPDEGQQGD